MATMKRTFHPVGHGAFYTERFYDGDDNIANIVFDCGCYETAKSRMSPNAFKEQINNAITEEFNERVTIDALFISHFHTDHINGIAKLIEFCDVKRIFIPKLTPQIVLEAYLTNYVYYEDIGVVDNFIRSCQRGEIIVQVGEFYLDDEVRFKPLDLNAIRSNIDSPITIMALERKWQYIPFNLSDKDGKIVETIRANANFYSIWEEDGTINLDELSNVIRSIGPEECRKIYQSVYGDKHNSYSMTLYSGATYCCIERVCPRYLCQFDCRNPYFCIKNCLYMGDYEAKTHFDDLKRFYDDYWKCIGILQVPHHGSEKNFNAGLYTPEKICIISVGETDKYDHPDKLTLDGIIENRDIPIIITENQNTRQQFTYKI